MGLDRRTEQRLQELFGGKHCCECGLPAARLVGERFYCPRHFPRGKRRSTGEGRTARERRASA
jgi:hypothetical protein